MALLILPAPGVLKRIDSHIASVSLLRLFIFPSGEQLSALYSAEVERKLLQVIMLC
ncbi:hypothetical protein C5167_015469 [Papaver somniferum]|uniref:Uncharacterized protein n=1 Tax=Papaver somniferum TaxID=3469 RepID=A0A4Y7J980_PAPSO|nr:hypothetical protein C5167_015469 [Papaver somniferum]